MRYTQRDGSQIHKDEDGFRLTEYEWHYQGNGTYIRTYKRIIEGLELIVEPQKDGIH